MTEIDIQFDTTDWTPTGPNTWTNQSGESLLVSRFDVEPDLPADLDDAELLAARWPIAGGGNLGVSVTTVDGLPAVEVLTKFRRDPHGIVIVGSLIVPTATNSHVVRVQCPEVGTTGVRESMVLSKLLERGHDFPVLDGRLKGWQVGPDLDPPLQAANLADAEKWDDLLPDHCLTRCRKHLRHLAATARLGAETHASPPFRFRSE